MHPVSSTLRSVFLCAAGTGGSLIALLKPWQEHLEWGARMVLLTVSIASVLAGLFVAARKRPPSP